MSKNFILEIVIVLSIFCFVIMFYFIDKSSDAYRLKRDAICNADCIENGKTDWTCMRNCHLLN
jgi:hypothetical protein